MFERKTKCKNITRLVVRGEKWEGKFLQASRTTNGQKAREGSTLTWCCEGLDMSGLREGWGLILGEKKLEKKMLGPPF